MDVNLVILTGRIGQDVEIRSLGSGDRVANFSIATDTGWTDRESGEWRNNTHWHNIVTFQPGLIKLLERRGLKGARVLVQGELTTSSWRKDGESSDRTKVEVKVDRDGKITFQDPEKKTPSE